jgi:hypothetical protein
MTPYKPRSPDLERQLQQLQARLAEVERQLEQERQETERLRARLRQLGISDTP